MAGRKKAPLTLGRPVKVRRADNQMVRGVVISGPIAHLLPIGEFYLIGDRLPEGMTDVPHYRGTGRKTKERLRYEAETGRIGMYERGHILA